MDTQPVSDHENYDSDFEELPPLSGDIDENEDDKAPKFCPGFSYMRIYQPPKGFNDSEQVMLLPNCPVNVKIIDILVDPQMSSKILNPNLYVIEVQHGKFTWIVKRRHKHFQSLHQQLMLFRASLNIPIPTRKHKERRKSLKANNRPLPRFPRIPEAIISHDNVPRRAEQLEEYLQNCLKIPMYRTHHEMMSFLDISPLSFIEDLGDKGKEGLVKKRAGGFRQATCCVRMTNFITDMTGHWRKRWLVVKDNFVCYIKPKDGQIRAVLLMDQGFHAKYGVAQIGIHHGVKISNLSRDLILKCWTKRKANELADYLNETSRTLAKDFTQANRFDSFVPIRNSIDAQWFIDGATYFEAVSNAIDSAKEQIFIADWWLTPEIYMKRPVIDGNVWRLDRLLQRKAESGVKIYVLIFKEVELAIGINSLYSKHQLMKLHPNIKVLRHPDPSRGGPLFWSHHEKIVVIDQTYAFIAGIDLCYGRWDNFQHKLTDLGGIALDPNVVQIKTSAAPLGVKTRSRSQPQLSEGTTQFHVSFDDINSIVINEKGDIEKTKDKVCNDNQSTKEASEKEETNKQSELPPTSKFKQRMAKLRSQRVIQAVTRLQTMRRFRNRRVSDSIEDVDGVDWHDEDYNAMRRTTSESTLHDMGIQGGSKLWFGKDYCNFIVKDFYDLNQPYKDLVDRNSIPRMPWHDIGVLVTGAAARDVARHFIQRWNFTKTGKAKVHQSYPWLLPKSYVNISKVPRPKFLTKRYQVSCQVVRSVSSWSAGTKTIESSIQSAYIDIINNSKHYIYFENQFFISQCSGKSSSSSNVVFNGIGEALYWRIIRAYRNEEVFRVYVLFPLLPAFEGEVGTSRGTAIQAITHFNYATICRGSNSLMQRLQKEVGDVSKYITFYGLRNYGELNGKLTTELVYIHSKLLIADDRIAIIGSSNINDRSLLGSRDSEIAVVISDEEFDTNGVMNGERYDSGKFSGSLRRTLMREHLGLMTSNPERLDVRDPTSEKFYKELWVATAAVNTTIYDKVFGVIPTDEVRTFAQLREYQQKEKIVSTNEKEAREMIKKIRGHLVLTPLFFLCDEDLLPSAGTKEALMPVSLWT